MESISAALVNQAPGMVVLLIIVFAFLKYQQARELQYNAYLEKRDQLYMDLVRQISDEIKDLTDRFQVHAAETTGALAEMRRTVARNQKLNEELRKQNAES